MKKLLKTVSMLTLALAVSGAVLAGGPPSTHKGKTPKNHHNPKKPGPASNAKPGGHAQTHIVTNRG